MNKVLMAALATVLASTGMAQAASTGTISFDGELTESTCDVSVDGQGADANVTLPTLSTSQLATAGQTAGRSAFVMDVSGCTGTSTSVAAFFEAGTSVDLATGRLKNLTGTATNVSLQLRDGSAAAQDVIKAGSGTQSTNTQFVNLATNAATLPYLVEYYAEAQTTAGTVKSNIVYSLMYK